MPRWKKITEGLSHGGYVAWEAAIAAATGESRRTHLPVFLRLKQLDDGLMTLAAAIDATLALPGVLFSRHERDLLITDRDQAGPTGWPYEVRAVAFCPRAMLQNPPPFWDVLQVGPGLAIPHTPDTSAGQNLTRTRGDLPANVPLLAVIDDGIGFLNTRFRKTRHQTRLKSVWLQAPERVPDPGAAPRADVVCGRVLTGADIDAHLGIGAEEADVYRQVNRALLPRTDGALTNARVAHGTHVLDLAAGAAPWARDPLAAVPLLAVQLPPAAIRETAGRRMEAYLVQGLRWILAETLRLSHHTDVPPVVINLSLGSLAGPGDETAFLAQWFQYELDRHTRLTHGGTVRLVVAYGNARQSRLVARAELRRSTPMVLQWRVLPDDHSSSFLELRVDAGMTRGLKLILTPPKGSGLPALAVDWPDDGQGWQLAGPIAAVTSVTEQGGQSLLMVALGPSAGDGALASCPPGAWQVDLRTTEAEPVRLIARVQRDDTPFGHRTLGRQSWLDHPQGWDWDDETRAYMAPRPAADAPGCPVTREGTGVAFAGAQDTRILFVGSVRPATGAPDQVVPLRYSSEGVRHLARPGESHGPTLVARGDDGAVLAGRAAAGVLSGSVARLSGTSMAAPLVARALLAYFLQTPPDQRSAMAERRALTGTDAWADPDPRLGHGTLPVPRTRGMVT